MQVRTLSFGEVLTVMDDTIHQHGRKNKKIMEKECAQVHSHLMERITTLEQLALLAMNRKSVVTNRGLRIPAAVAMNWNGWELLRQFQGNGMAVYVKASSPQRTASNPPASDQSTPAAPTL